MLSHIPKKQKKKTCIIQGRVYIKKRRSEERNRKESVCKVAAAMGALAPVSHWIPEDDLLLKNAIEVLNHCVCNSMNLYACLFLALL